MKCTYSKLVVDLLEPIKIKKLHKGIVVVILTGLKNTVSMLVDAMCDVSINDALLAGELRNVLLNWRKLKLVSTYEGLPHITIVY